MLILFLSLVSLFSTFFYVDSDAEIRISEYEDVDGFDAWMPGGVVGEDYTYRYNNVTGELELVPIDPDTGEVVEEETTDWFYFALGAVLVTVGVIALPFTGGLSSGLIVAGTIAGGVVSLVHGLDTTIMSNVPLIGDVFTGLNYVAMSLSSFMGLMSWNGGLLSHVPWLAMLIIGPVTFVFFYIFIAIARGVSA